MRNPKYLIYIRKVIFHLSLGKVVVFVRPSLFLIDTDKRSVYYCSWEL